MAQNEKKLIKGISVCNPVDVDRDYLLFTVEYAAKNGFDHLQIIGPIHDYVKGNIDGMTLYRKYSRFNSEKDAEYVALSTDVVNEACSRAKAHQIKTYMWHHELYLPSDFKNTYPETLNDYGDIEVSHPLVQDFLENKISDFFHTYPDMDGIILTLHETSIPLLKLKNQKLDKIARVKHVTKILYDSCAALGKELVVRPFASIEEDYVMMTKAYEEISRDLMIMDKWTQFDWSLTMPSNQFFNKIKENPLFIEADIFGEFFGKGRLPLMLEQHIANKFAYCRDFQPAGYVARIDRAGQIPFGDVNEVNLTIMKAHLDGRDPKPVICRFFAEKYPQAAEEVRALMEKTEEILTKTIYINGYLFSELSIFPSLNHSKNHYYFEMMKENYCIDSNEWYIPKDWNRGPLKALLDEKEEAAAAARQLLSRLELLKGKIEVAEYEKLWVKFCNLQLVTEAWRMLTVVFMDYVKYFETKDISYAQAFEKNTESLLALARRGEECLGAQFYCVNGNRGQADYIGNFVQDIRKSFLLEKEATARIEAEGGALDYIICGSGMEGHHLQKEVNFSDTLIYENRLCRIPGNRKGMEWSSINAHGWFSYLLQVKPNAENTIKIAMGNPQKQLSCLVTIGQETYTIDEPCCGEKEFTFSYTESNGQNQVRISVEKISAHTPLVYTISVY